MLCFAPSNGTTSGSEARWLEGVFKQGVLCFAANHGQLAGGKTLSERTESCAASAKPSSSERSPSCPRKNWHAVVWRSCSRASVLSATVPVALRRLQNLLRNGEPKSCHKENRQPSWPLKGISRNTFCLNSGDCGSTNFPSSVSRRSCPGFPVT